MKTYKNHRSAIVEAPLPLHYFSEINDRGKTNTEEPKDIEKDKQEYSKCDSLACHMALAG
jgi:hypothetical protein